MITILPSRIVLFGVSGSGKSTLGQLMNQYYGHVPIGCADPIKRAAKEIFGFADEHLYGPSELRETPYEAFEFRGFCPRCGKGCVWTTDTWHCYYCGAVYGKYITPRLALQTLGTEWGRLLCEDLWARVCFRGMREDTSYIVTDARFYTELKVAKEHHACCVLLLRNLEHSTSNHQSEAEIRGLAENPNAFHIRLDNREGEPLENFWKLIELCTSTKNDHITRSYHELNHATKR